MQANVLSRARILALALPIIITGLALPFSSETRAEFPEKTVRIIVPFAPGVAVDGVARPTAVELTKAFGQTVIVENKPGSGGVIGIQTAARAVADGHTLLLGNIALASAPALHPKSGADPKDFAPVALIGSSPYVLLVRADSPLKTTSDLIAFAKSQPGKLNYASAGAGSAIHLAGELLKAKAGLDIVHVPYKGAGPALVALLGGEVDLMFGSAPEVKNMLQAGRVRALAVTSVARYSQLPQLPTLTESGIRDFAMTGWYGLYAPLKTPPAVLKRVQELALTGLRSDALRQQLTQYGVEIAKGGPKDAQDMLDAETDNWSAIIRNAGIQAD